MKNNKPIGKFLCHFKNAFDERRKNSDIYEYTRETVRIYLKNPKSAYFAFASFYYICAYFFGSRLTHYLIRKPAYRLGIMPWICKNPAKKMYHWAPAEFVSDILQKGMMGKDKVYITDDPSFIKKYGYFEYKENETGRRLDFVLLAIDTKCLYRHEKIFHHDFCPHEYFVNYIPPKCISVVDLS